MKDGTPSPPRRDLVYNDLEATDMAMRRVKGTFDGSTVVLREKVDLPPDTEVEVLIPDPEGKSLAALLETLDRLPAAEILSAEEVSELVHEVRAGQR